VSGERLSLDILDDGDGFDASARRQGLGLLGMRERAEAMNGEFFLESSPGGGVRIRVDVPVTAMHGQSQEKPV